ncbi:sulfatase [Pontiella sulfatireligans]|uniref:Choline-sulfatase n=1 Tax=Pontiella sulfatireligans TaxID=2750658 RepID=A0A6C2UTB7_9BACT|nr:sulfatase [Pontiella sulfatireligans]SPS74592.1 sulfatase S1_7 [Kiritimatiellales bacterium]VGO23570.1 Choline-sulfatase [Pontiella sulfatireligans]
MKYWIIVFWLLSGMGVYAGNSKPLEKPNVLFIVADDLNVDIACYGHPIVKTPNIDKLRARGMVFDRAYSQYPLCNPSRNSFLTGLYPGTSGCLDNGMNIREAVPDVVTLPQVFRNNGYKTITTGKIFHQKDPASWTHISNVRTGGLLPTDKEPEYYLHGWSDEGKTKGEGRFLADETVKWFEWRSVTEGEDLLKDGRVMRASKNRADEILEDGAPFFLCAGFARPHDPYFAPKRFFDLYPLESLTLPVTPSDASAIPDHAFYSVFKKAFETMDEPKKREAMRAYYAGISYMDEQLGLLMDYMEEKGLLENTVIVFMGDHGYQVGEKNYWNKGLLFERSCRAPLIIAAPGMKTAGETCERIVEFVDIYPTLTGLCGLDDLEGLDGTSLVPILGNPNAERKEIAYSYCNADRSVRDPRFRYIVWKSGGHALYDHQKDPGEHYNLADNPECAPVVKRMKSLIDSMPEPKGK